jgi:hypothetical protein
MIKFLRKYWYLIFRKEYKIFLDDLRIPKTTGWTIARNYEEFKTLIIKYGLPTKISFDHDLGDFEQDNEKTGYSCAKWLVEWCMDNNKPIPEYNVHSANPVGKENIDSYFKSYEKFRTKHQ